MDRLTVDGISWAPARKVFVNRVGITAALTFVALLIVGVVFSWRFDLPMGWAVIVALTLTCAFVLEDAMHWRNTRTDRWQIDEGQLIHDGAEGRSQIPLSEVTQVRTQFGGRIIVTLQSGQRMAIRYLPYPETVAEQINAARGPAQRTQDQ